MHQASEPSVLRDSGQVEASSGKLLRVAGGPGAVQGGPSLDESLLRGSVGGINFVKQVPIL